VRRRQARPEHQLMYAFRGSAPYFAWFARGYQGPAASGEGAGSPACQAVAAWIR